MNMNILNIKTQFRHYQSKEYVGSIIMGLRMAYSGSIINLFKRVFYLCLKVQVKELCDLYIHLSFLLQSAHKTLVNTDAHKSYLRDLPKW